MYTNTIYIYLPGIYYKLKYGFCWLFQMLSLEDGWKWPALGLFLFLVTFGSVGLLSLGYVICILMGYVTN